MEGNSENSCGGRGKQIGEKNKRRNKSQVQYLYRMEKDGDWGKKSSIVLPQQNL